jgi:nitroreductase
MVMEKKMSRREFLKVSATTGAILTTGSALLSVKPNITSAEGVKPIQLSKPPVSSENPLLQLLGKRKSSREFGPGPLPVEVLSNMLWAAFGINRPDGKRTAPSARNQQEIDIYVATGNGLYLYDAKANSLNPILSEDIRGMTGRQPYVKEAAVNLVYVADYSRMGTSPEEEKVFYSVADAGFISENIYLYCASEGLATVVRAYIDRPALASVMKLRDRKSVV